MLLLILTVWISKKQKKFQKEFTQNFYSSQLMVSNSDGIILIESDQTINSHAMLTELLI